MNIITDKFTFGGNSLGKIDGKNVFIPYTIPGEEIEIKITESKKDYDSAEIVKIVTPSPYRKEPECPYYGKCGGCNMMHIQDEYQTELRKNILEDIFRQNGVEIKCGIQIISGPSTGYRARFQLNDGGLSEKKSNTIIPIESCICAEAEINDYLKETPPEKRGKGRIHIFGSSFMTKNGQNSQKIITAKGNNTDYVEKTVQYDNFSEINQQKKSDWQRKKQKKVKENRYFAGSTLSEENCVTVGLNGKELTFDVRGFFQSNLFVFQKVVSLITDSLPSGKNVLDMYSGCGSISAFLADKFECVTMVEHNRDAVVFAEKNLAGKNHISYGLSGENWVKNCAAYCPTFDACVVDPPRSGMEFKVREYLCNSGIPVIASLSCDPATHARDCAKLIKAGYSLDKLYLLDFYPNTSHIESLAIFSRI